MKTVSMSFLVVLCVGLQSMGAQLIFKNNARVSVPSCVLHVPEGDAYKQLSAKGYIVKQDDLIVVSAEDTTGSMPTGKIVTDFDINAMPSGEMFLTFSGYVVQGLIGQQANTTTSLQLAYENPEYKDMDWKKLTYTQLKDFSGVGNTKLFNLTGLPSCK